MVEGGNRPSGRLSVGNLECVPMHTCEKKSIKVALHRHESAIARDCGQSTIVSKTTCDTEVDAVSYALRTEGDSFFLRARIRYVDGVVTPCGNDFWDASECVAHADIPAGYEY